MTIIPVSMLQPADLIRLGNNLMPAIRRDREQQLDPVHRSLASVGECNVRFDCNQGNMRVHDPAICE